MDKINENLYQANIELVDRNKLLEKDVGILQKKIDTAIEYIVHPTFTGRNSTNEEILVDILRILKGEEDGDNR